MSPLKIILVATDFSVAAETALDFALPLAATLGAKVYLLHAYQLPPKSVLVTTAQIALGLTAWPKKNSPTAWRSAGRAASRSFRC